MSIVNEFLIIKTDIMKQIYRLLVLALILASHFVESQENEVYGYIEFPASVSPDLHPLFIKGVLLLHNFQYEDAKQVFIQLQKQAPDFAMAYWGEAMTYNHPLWDEQDLEEAKESLNKLAPKPEERVSKAKTPQEKGFLNAINILYGTGDKNQRDVAYTIAMCELYVKFPDDDEIALFYALAVLGKERGIRNYTEYMKAASVSNDVYMRNHKHPGAAHYLIHSLDDPIHAPLGLEAARSYSKIAPAAAHAAHMPSHIYLPLGMWEDVIESNEKAWNGCEERIQRLHLSELDHDTHDLHALEWLVYGLLQAGKEGQAYEYTKMMHGITQASGSNMYKWYYAIMRASYLVDTQKWDADLPSFDMAGIDLGAAACDIYANALIRLHKDQKNIDDLIQKLQVLYDEQTQRYQNLKQPSKDYFTSVHAEGLQAAKVILLQLTALNQKHKGNFSQAIETLEKALIVEEGVPVGYGPPVPPKPSRELLGELLLENNQYMAACRQFQEELKRYPKRRIAVQTIEKISQSDSNCQQPKIIFYNRLLNPNADVDSI